MIRRHRGRLLVIATVLAVPVVIQAASWTFVGQSGFTVANDPGVNSRLKDHRRLPIHSLVVDGSGDVYFTAGVNTTNEATSAALRAGVTVIPDGTGTPVDIDLTPFPGDGTYPAGRNIPGGITKMAVAGDGHVYALQGYYEIDFASTSGTFKHKILRLRRDPQNPGAYLSEAIFDMNAERLALGFTLTESNPDRDIIGGMTVANDGNVYWTCGQQLSNIWKFRFLYRYDTLTNTLERSPLNCGPKGDGTVPNCSVAQGGTNERMFNLEAVGTDSTLAGPNQNWFAVIWQAAVGGAGQTWGLDGMTWDVGRAGVGANGSTGVGSLYGVWWRDYLTATAYDPVRNKLWVAGRSRTPNSGSNNSGRAWEIGSGDTSNCRNPAMDGNATVLKVVKLNNTTLRHWRRRPGVGDAAVTLGTRFRVQDYSSDFGGSIMHVSARTPNNTPATAQVVLAIRGDHLVVLDAVGPSGVYTNPQWMQLADLTPSESLDTNRYYEVHMYADTTGLVKVWLDGNLTTITNANLRETSTATDGVGFGAGSAKSQNSTGTATILFDWVGYANSEVPGGTNPEPTNIWPSQALADGGILGAFLDGTVLPHEFNSSNVIVRFNGKSSNPALFSGSPPSLASELQPIAAWAANGNNPGLLGGTDQIGTEGLAGSPASNVPNGGAYWVSALAVNPCDGTAWMAWSGTDKYEENLSNLPAGDTTARRVAKYAYNGTYGPIGRVYTVGAEGTIYTAGGDEGEVLPGGTGNSQVVGLAFRGRTVYALVEDLATNPATFNVYKAANPVNTCCNEVAFDVDGDSDVDMVDFGVFQACYTGTATPPDPLPYPCGCLDRNHDGKVESFDFGAFLGCANGPALAPGANCQN